MDISHSCFLLPSIAIGSHKNNIFFDIFAGYIIRPLAIANIKSMPLTNSVIIDAIVNPDYFSSLIQNLSFIRLNVSSQKLLHIQRTNKADPLAVLLIIYR